MPVAMPPARPPVAVTAATPAPAAAPVTASAVADSFDASVDGNDIRVIWSGPARFAALRQVIEGACVSIDLAFYIYDPDTAGTWLRDALIAAAQRGVRVRMLLDAFGSATTPDDFFADLRAAGGVVRWFGTRLTPRSLIRNHQKLVIVDGETVMAGGFNIADSYFTPDDERDGWADLGFVLNGPAVLSAIRWFDGLADWMAAPRPRFRALRRLVRQWRDRGTVGWVVGGPTVRLSPWARSLRHDLRRGGSVQLAMGYFAPSAGFMRRLTRIARRGGPVRLLLPARTDNGATVGASRLLYGWLLRSGAHIAEYERQRLHAKIIVVDDISYIGSANMDMRSLFVNMELMLRVEDAAFAEQCRALLDAHTAGATIITPELHKHRAGPLTRLRWFASWLVVSVIDYGITRRLNFGLNTPLEEDR
jgi:cardiolipin synthase